MKFDEQLHQKIIEFFRDAEEDMKHPIQVGCSACGVEDVSCTSCSTPGCCYQKINAHLFEVIPLAFWLRKEGRDTPQLRARLKDAWNKMECEGFEEFFASNTPCVFLEDDKCSIYPYRPIECRVYWVFSPPELCCPPSRKTVSVANHSRVAHAGLVFSNDVNRYLQIKETAKRVILSSFPRMLLIMLESFDSELPFKQFIRQQVWPTDDDVLKLCSYEHATEYEQRLRDRG